MASISSIYFLPPQRSHVITTSSRKLISIEIYPLPLHLGHAPFELKLKSEGSLPVALANSLRIWSKIPVYVAGFDRVLLPAGVWSTTIASLYFLQKTSCIRLLLPLPATP